MPRSTTWSTETAEMSGTDTTWYMAVLFVHVGPVPQHARNRTADLQSCPHPPRRATAQVGQHRGHCNQRCHPKMHTGVGPDRTENVISAWICIQTTAVVEPYDCSTCQRKGKQDRRMCRPHLHCPGDRHPEKPDEPTDYGSDHQRRSCPAEKSPCFFYGCMHRLNCLLLQFVDSSVHSFGLPCSGYSCRFGSYSIMLSNWFQRISPIPSQQEAPPHRRKGFFDYRFSRRMSFPRNGMV